MLGESLAVTYIVITAYISGAVTMMYVIKRKEHKIKEERVRE